MSKNRHKAGHGRDIPVSDRPLPRPLQIEVATVASAGCLRLRAGNSPPNAEELDSDWEVSSETLAAGASALASRPEAVRQALAEALLGKLVERRLRAAPGTLVTLGFLDHRAARWPWELAGRELPNVTGIGRQVAGPSATRAEAAADALVEAPAVGIAVLDERKDRGLVSELLEESYGRGTCRAIAADLLEPAAGGDRPLGGSALCIFHLVARMAPGGETAGILLPGGEVLTAEAVAGWIVGPGPRLLVMDVVLARSDADAAEQMMAANAFCWTLTHLEPSLAVLTGAFAGSNDRVPHLQALVGGLQAGRTLAETTSSLQSLAPVLPGGARHPVRGAVAVWSQAFDRRFRIRS